MVMVKAIDVSVVGGPSTLNVDVDYGPEGRRGSQIFVGFGDPNSESTVIGQSPEINDIFINVSTALPQEYLNGYQYKNDDGQLSWINVFKLLPNQHSLNIEAVFNESGVAEDIVIPIANLSTTPLSLQPENLNIQYSIVGAGPVASSITVSPQFVEVSGGVLALSFDITAAELVGGEWSPLTGTKTVHLFITVV
jgi:hypothetical protein